MFMNRNLLLALALALALAASLAQAQVSLQLTEGSTTKTCTTIGDVVVTSTGLRASVADGCLGVVDEGTPTDPPENYTLTVSKTGSGTVSSSPSGIACGATCSASFASGASVTLTAVPESSWNFGSWAGCASTSGTECTVSMTAARSVTATFTEQTSGGTTDPGGDTVWNPDSSTYVHGRGVQAELFVPRCVPTQYNNCRYGGQQSPYDTVKAGEVWAMRIPHGQSSELKTYDFAVNRAETGESLNSFDISISTTVGDFGSSLETGCRQFAGSKLTVFDGTLTTVRRSWLCPIDPNKTYYLNVRPAVGFEGETKCGTSSTNACRYRIVLPSGFPYSS